MTIFKVLTMAATFAAGISLCCAAEKQNAKEKPATPAAPAGQMFSTNVSGGQGKPAPFAAEISADFIKKVMETSARIEECKKQIAERQTYLFESNPQLKAYRQELIEMQKKINTILETDQELANLRLNRDILWTIMPVLPKMPDRRMSFPGAKERK